MSVTITCNKCGAHVTDELGPAIEWDDAHQARCKEVE